MASPLYSVDIESQFVLKSFWNGTTTVTFGQNLVWSTTTVIDATSDYPIQWGREATMATTTGAGAFPAGPFWGVSPSDGSGVFITGSALAANGAGLVLQRGVHPYVYMFGSVTFGDTLYISGAYSGCVYASNTYSASITVLGRSLFTSASDTVQLVGAYINIGAS